ncbi:MAG: hypothetical protein M1826_003622 [Phylliscum demangeonii]|nr:MAG: hypothetical protein M1826_003622 [Phylliscum demangeonii]
MTSEHVDPEAAAAAAAETTLRSRSSTISSTISSASTSVPPIPSPAPLPTTPAPAAKPARAKIGRGGRGNWVKTNPTGTTSTGSTTGLFSSSATSASVPLLSAPAGTQTAPTTGRRSQIRLLFRLGPPASQQPAALASTAAMGSSETLVPLAPTPAGSTTSTPSAFNSGRGGIGNARRGLRPIPVTDSDSDNLGGGAGRSSGFHFGRGGLGNTKVDNEGNAEHGRPGHNHQLGNAASPRPARRFAWMARPAGAKDRYSADGILRRMGRPFGRGK